MLSGKILPVLLGVLLLAGFGFADVFAQSNGNANANSNKVLTGEGPPPDKLGNLDDIYIDTNDPDNLIIYKKTGSNTWTNLGSFTGPQGEQGPAGADGQDGLSCWDLNGNGVGDIPDEDTDGSGTVDVLDCKGPQGEQGNIGSSGLDGVDGADGAPGPAGPAGATGPQGPAGPAGATGPQGPAGPTGDKAFTCFQSDGLSSSLKLRVDGQVIEGEHSRSGLDREDTIEVYGYCHELSDDSRFSGHSDVMVVKKIDRATPELYDALVSNSVVDSFNLRFFQPERTGAEEHFFTIDMINSQVIDITQITQETNPDENIHEQFEIVTFRVGEDMTWDHPDSQLVRDSSSINAAILDFNGVQCPPNSSSMVLDTFVEQIQGEVVIAGREGAIETFSSCNKIEDLSGGSTLQLSLGPITISKRMDSTTPQLIEKLLLDEVINNVTIDYYQPGAGPGGGSLTNFYTVELTDAKVVSVSQLTPKTIIAGSPTFAAIEEVAFTYTEMRVINHNDGSETVITIPKTK